MSDDDGRENLRRLLEYRKMFDGRFEQLDHQTPFDSVHDIDTGAPVELWDLPEAAELPLGRNARYAATPVRTVRNVLTRCGVRYEEVTFVDVGCGKGRVLLLASEFPFRRIVGVEASATLCEIARRNVAAVSKAHGGYGNIEVVHSDATRFEVPADAGLFYFYEPFSAEVSHSVLESIEASVRQFPREVVLCFVGRGQPEGIESELEATPVAAAAAEVRPVWELLASVPSPDAEFYDALLFRHADTVSP